MCWNVWFAYDKKKSSIYIEFFLIQIYQRVSFIKLNLNFLYSELIETFVVKKKAMLVKMSFNVSPIADNTIKDKKTKMK